MDIEKRLEEFDETMDLLRKAIESLNEQTAREARQIEQTMEDQRRKQLHEIEISHEEKKVELRRKYEKKMEESQFKSMKEDKQSVKLPKLVITKVTKMERNISFCSHVVLQEQFIWSYYQTRQWRNSFGA